MFKLNRQIQSLENIQVKIEEKIEDLRNKLEDIEDNALEHDREFTDSEFIKYQHMTTEIEELEQEVDDIQNALDILSEYEIYD